jgi:septin family protein
MSSKTTKTVKIDEVEKFTLESTFVDIDVHLYDSPGYGDYINNQNAIETVRSYLLNTHKAWSSMSNNNISDFVSLPTLFFFFN